MHGGEFKAYAKNGYFENPKKNYTPSQGKGPEDRPHQGQASRGLVFRQLINDPSPVNLSRFAEKAAAALSVNRWDLVIEDMHGRKVLGKSIENGTNNGQAQPYL